MIAKFEKDLQTEIIEDIAGKYRPLSQIKVQNEIAEALGLQREGEGLKPEDAVAELVRDRPFNLLFCEHKNLHLRRILIITATRVLEAHYKSSITLDNVALEKLLGQVLGVIAGVMVKPGDLTDKDFTPWGYSIQLLDALSMPNTEPVASLGFKIRREAKTTRQNITKATGSAIGFVGSGIGSGIGLVSSGFGRLRGNIASGVSYIGGGANSRARMNEAEKKDYIVRMLAWQGSAHFNVNIRKLGQVVPAGADRASPDTVVHALGNYLFGLQVGDFNKHKRVRSGTMAMCALVMYYEPTPEPDDKEI